MTHTGRVIVIGTGPAGATAALFLSRAGLEPLVLEAGSGKAELGLTARVRGVTLAKWKPALEQRQDLTNTGDPGAMLFEKLAPGGLSNHWACAVPRFAPDDFADAARAGTAYEWPIDYQELAPWYARVEPLLRIAGSARDVPSLPAGRVSSEQTLGPEWDAVTSRAAERGRDVVAMPYAYGDETTVTRAATPFNAFTRLVAPVAQAGGLSVRFDAQALRLEWSRAEKRVSAVICRNPRTGAEERIACRAVVLAAGAVNSAQILLESRSSELPEGIGNEAGLVGKYLHDHPLAKLVLRLGRQIPISPASYITRPPLSRSEPLYAAAFMQWSGVVAHARSVLAGHPGRTRELGYSIFGTMIPTAEDCVTLLPGARQGERSRIGFALRYPRYAVEVLEKARDELVAMLDEAGWAPTIDVFKVEPPGNSVHYGGTCRMHASPEYGVVDSNCRVFGARNVVVADSAVFTTGPEKNPVLTAMTLAARASERLADDLRAGDA
ncbi:MAG TPA: GMC family oxidoreductase [Polyangiaceae bacterium]|nr:GMC family oxidoreductase [Polyangiaceae bacterium]